MSAIYVYDVESFSNYFCAIFYDGSKTHVFRITDANMRSSIVLDAEYNAGGHNLAQFVCDKEKVLVGFNSFGYDDLLLRYIVSNPHASAQEINNLSQRIVASERMPDDLFKMQYAAYPWAHSVDMYQVTNKKGGLKEWQCRMHYPTVVETPTDFNAPLPVAAIADTERYCHNDVLSTWKLYQDHKHLVALREAIMAEYKVGSRVFVQPDAGVTKTIALASYKENTGGWSSTARDAARLCEDNVRRRWRADELVAANVRYQTDEFRLFERFFRSCDLVGDAQGTTWEYADGNFKAPVVLAGVRFQIGVGGLHSVDSPGRFEATADVGIYDLDVASYYPSLILTLGLFPKHIGPEFLHDYRRIRDQRVEAKRAGNKQKANMYKLVLNTTFGVLNEAHSPIRSIPSALRVTLNGQLQLLMLVERLHMLGARILSANTDGVTIMWHRARMAEVAAVCRAWEKDTGHELEQAEYARYCRRDVNSYCALKTDGEVKTKGAFEQSPVGGKTDERIVKDAAMRHLMCGTPIADTVNASQDIRDFIYYQRTKKGDGLFYGDQNLGKTARWYRSLSSTAGVRRRNTDGSFACVPNGANATLALTLPTSIPADLDRAHYMREARELVESITKMPKKGWPQ